MNKNLLISLSLAIVMIPSLCSAEIKNLYIQGTQTAIILQSIEHTLYKDNNIIKVSISFQDSEDPSIIHLNNIWINTDNNTVFIKKENERKLLDNRQVKVIKNIYFDPEDESNWEAFDINDDNDNTVKLLNTLNDNGL